MPQMRADTKKALTAMVLAVLAMASVSCQARASEKPLNVIFILADDLGYSDTTLYGTTKLYQTPNIERLAERGMTFNRAYANSPLEHGFDVDIPYTPAPGPGGGYLAPWHFAKDLQPQARGEHIEDRMAEEAIKWMNALPKNKPFFMNYWQFSVHAPFEAKPELVEKYKKPVDPNSRQKSPTYAAMVEICDDAAGALLDAVDAAGIADRTIIVFTSDNGGNVHQKIEADGGPVTSNFPHIGGKATIREGGVHVPSVVVWPGVTKPGSRSNEIIQTSDLYPTLLKNLGMGLPENHAVDGIDIMPALKGGELDRDGIFTYFPTGMPAPDWLPPSMSVHSDDWKLIRIFHGGDNGAHDYRLYNLADDIGEQSDLASSYPEKVRMLDQLIENHIQETKAVVPQPNPDFDPEQYHPERIGLPPDQWKSDERTKAKPDKNPDEESYGEPSEIVDGWIAGGASSLFQKEGRLIVKCTGGGSFFRVQELKSLKGGPFTLTFSMTSNASGKGSIFYNRPSRDTLIPFSLEHDGRSHEYAVEIPVETLNGLRINPAKSTGTIEVDWIRILDNTGKAVRSWDFGDGTAAKSAPAKSKYEGQKQPTS
jgi:arylsulfatase A-like enzyme